MSTSTHEEFFVSSMLERAMRHNINMSKKSSCAAPGPRRNTKIRRTDSQWRNPNTAIGLKPTKILIPMFAAVHTGQPHCQREHDRPKIYRSGKVVTTLERAFALDTCIICLFLSEDGEFCTD